jgi:hypothetical protein
LSTIGTVTITTHAHDSGFILFTARGDAFSYQHSGHVEGASAGDLRFWTTA